MFLIIVLCDVVQKQIVAVDFCKPVRSKKIERAVCSKDFWSILYEFFFQKRHVNLIYNGNL
jgi:hypothetical protein